MGQIASDYFKKYGSAYIAENPFTVEELIRMGSHDIQEEYAGLMDSEESYIPAELLASLLRDRAFFTNLLALRDSGRIIALRWRQIRCRSFVTVQRIIYVWADSLFAEIGIRSYFICHLWHVIPGPDILSGHCCAKKYNSTVSGLLSKVE